MCLGPELMTVVSLAATAASTYAQSQAAKAQQKAAFDAAARQNELLGAELQRQNQFGQQSDELVKQAIPQYDTEGYADRFAKAKAEREAIITAPLVTGGADYAGNPTAPKTLQAEGEQRLAEGREKGRTTALSLANLGSYGLADLYGNMGMMDLNSQLGQIGSFSRGSNLALGAEKNQAMNEYNVNAPWAGQNAAQAADFLSGAGNIAAIYGAAGQRTKKPPEKTPLKYFP